eukprot:TRINITY_DN21000_c0_g1_i1.p1 TRINITY_DN21000_c0_g1~~TRINITY_DN21000_c0_g1_i1.p1  ORF type:complete len:101 (+),score=15.89 TRINITY_DN21000_c0_g1_i1:83-385(+)
MLNLFRGQWLPEAKVEEIEGIEPDPETREHRQVAAKPYKGYVPTHDDILNYRDKCDGECLEAYEMGSVQWSQCKTICAKEVIQLTKKATTFRSTVGPGET